MNERGEEIRAAPIEEDIATGRAKDGIRRVSPWGGVAVRCAKDEYVFVTRKGLLWGSCEAACRHKNEGGERYEDQTYERKS